MRRLARERALYQYTSALDRGDFDAVAEVLHQAETDEALECMILEVNEVYRTEVAGAVREGGRRGRVGEWLAARRRRRAKDRRGGEMADKKDSSKRGLVVGGRRFAPGVVTGTVVAAVVVTCVGAVLLVSLLRSAFTYDIVNYAPPGPGLPGLGDEEIAMVERAPAPAQDAGEMASWAAVDLDDSKVAQELEGERLIIRTGSIQLRVEDTLAAQRAVQALVARYAGEGAYVVSSDQRGGSDDQDPYISMAIRVPAARFDETMDALADLAVDVVSRVESADDVTEEYVDLEGRLEALEAACDRLLEIMAEADRTEDLLAAEEQLTRREEELEAIKGRMQYLSQSAALARISVGLEPYVLSQPVGERWRPAETVREALEALLHGAQGLVDFVIVFSIAVLPWLLALVLGVYLVYRFVRWAVRRRQARRGAPEAAGEGDPDS